MKGNALPLLIGALLGGGVVAIFMSGGAEPDAPDRTERSAEAVEQDRLVIEQANRLAELKTELADTKTELAMEKKRREEIEAAHAPKPETAKAAPDDDKPLTDEEFEAGVRKFAGRLQSIILGDGTEAREELRALLKRAGPEGMAKVKKQFLDPASGFQGRLIAGHVLGQSGDAEAWMVLKETLRDPEADMLEHRVASHALAFSDDPDAATLLTQVARTDPDPGARANSAFGLIQRDIDEGYELYAEATDLAFEKNQPEALQYLQGFFIMKDKALPYVRERLLTYKNETALLVLIELVKRKKDKGAMEQLKKLAYDTARPKSVQNSARGAINALGGE
ncbi:MAG: HEAT repeat domain-containing protein [Planctomycetota bacterium]|jgi:hypothetical protein